MKLSGPLAKHMTEYEEGAFFLLALGCEQETLNEYMEFVNKEKELDKTTGTTFKERNPDFYDSEKIKEIMERANNEHFCCS